MQKRIVEFLKKFVSHGNKITQGNSYHQIYQFTFHQIYQFTFILYGDGVHCDVDIFTLTARESAFMEKSMA